MPRCLSPPGCCLNVCLRYRLGIFNVILADARHKPWNRSKLTTGAPALKQLLEVGDASGFLMLNWSLHQFAMEIRNTRFPKPYQYFDQTQRGWSCGESLYGMALSILRNNLAARCIPERPRFRWIPHKEPRGTPEMSQLQWKKYVYNNEGRANCDVDDSYDVLMSVLMVFGDFDVCFGWLLTCVFDGSQLSMFDIFDRIWYPNLTLKNTWGLRPMESFFSSVQLKIVPLNRCTSIKGTG